LHWLLKSLKILLILTLIAVVVIFITLFCISIFTNQPYWSQYDFSISGAEEIKQKFGDDFDSVFTTNKDINQIINASKNLKFIKERKAELHGLIFTVVYENAELVFSDITLYYYSPIENNDYPTGQIRVNVFLPNEEIKYSVYGTFAKNHKRKSLIGIIDEDVIDGKRLDKSIDNNFIESIIPMGKNKHEIIFSTDRKISIDGVDYHE